MKIKVGVIGATGYAGAELVRLLLSHKGTDLTGLGSVSYTDSPISDIYPNLRGICDGVLSDEDAVIGGSDIVFVSLPHGHSEKIAAKILAKGAKMIDLGADFRLECESSYEKWYSLKYGAPELHAASLYCIPELHRAKINSAVKIIGNPGCYPTSIALGLAPVLINGAIDADTVIIDSKSGATGAGRAMTMTTHYPECNENFAAYKAAEHRHTPEIEETLSALAGKAVTVTFVPHLLPINRGILSTVYCSSKNNSAENILDMYKEYYAGEKFVRVLPLGSYAAVKNVKYSNYCDISVHYDKRTERLIITSALDNMVKGASGQAIQNMNILAGRAESEGLELIPPAF